MKEPQNVNMHHASFINSLIAQSVERRTFNPLVQGSSPGLAAKQNNWLHEIKKLAVYY